MRHIQVSSGEADAGGIALYRETVAFGKVYHGVMWTLLLVLLAGLVAFGLTRLYAGVIAVGLTLPMVGWIFAGCRKMDLIVTKNCFEVRYWLKHLAVPLDTIASVHIQDRLVLPSPYDGHAKVGYGSHSWPDLKVFVCRKGLPVVVMKTQDGVTVIVTPLRADRLAEALRGSLMPDNPSVTGPDQPIDASRI
jgi:hypothetical protein